MSSRSILFEGTRKLLQAFIACFVSLALIGTQVPFANAEEYGETVPVGAASDDDGVDAAVAGGQRAAASIADEPSACEGHLDDPALRTDSEELDSPESENLSDEKLDAPLQGLSTEAQVTVPEADSSEEAADEAQAVAEPRDDCVSGEVIVTFEAPSSAARALDAEDAAVSSLEECEVEVTEEIAVASEDLGAVVAAQIPASKTVDQVVAELSGSPGVAHVQPNYQYRLIDGIEESSSGSDSPARLLAESDATPAVDDPLCNDSTAYNANQYYLYQSGVVDAWNRAKSEGSATVAVLDTGCRLDHADLSGVLDVGHAYDTFHDAYLTESPVANGDAMGHGTHVAGIVCAQANNGIGIAGASYNASVLPVKVFNDEASASKAVATTADIVKAYSYLEGLINAGSLDNLRVVNLSLGYYPKDATSGDLVFEQAIQSMRDRHGVLTVCAGGNGDGSKTPYTNRSLPSDFDACLSVTALDRDGGNTVWSDYNQYKDISAPGTFITSASYADANGYRTLSGTSMAAPLVSGIAVLLWAANPNLGVDQVVSAIEGTADPISDAENDRAALSGSHGAVNAKAAVDSVLAQGGSEQGDPATGSELGGNARNLLLLVRFADDATGDGSTGFNASHAPYRTAWEYLTTAFNEPDHTAFTGWSFRNYLYEVSGGKHDVVTDFPQTQQDGRVAYITLDQKASDFGKNDDLRFLHAVVDKFNSAYGSYNAGRIDLDADGVVDNVLVVPTGVSSNESTPFFNHKAYASDPSLRIGAGDGSREVNVYNIVPTSGDGSPLDWGVVAHEYLHTLGAKDYYRDSGVGSPVGVWDIMASSGSRSRMLAVTREELGWTTIPEKGEGTFTLTSAGSQDGQAVMFKSPLNDTEYFVAEYRKKGEGVPALDSKIGGSGLIVYRVNPAFANEGNIAGNDYVYVFRSGETGLGDSYAGEYAGNLANAQVAVPGYATELARSSVGTPDLSADITQGALCYSNGRNSGIVIEATAQTDDSITFNISYPDYAAADLWDVVANADGSGSMLGSDVSGIQLATDGRDLYAALEALGGHQVMKYDGTTWSDLGVAARNAYTARIAAADGEAYVLAALDDGNGTLALRKHEGSAWSDVASVRLGSGATANQLALGFAGGSLYVLAGANDEAVKLYRLEGGSLRAVSGALPIGDIAHPELFELGGNPAVACGEPGANKSHVFEFAGGGWTSRSEIDGGSSNVNSVARGDGETYVYQCLGQGAQSAPKLLVFDGLGNRTKMVDVPKLTGTFLEGSLAFASGRLYLTLNDGQEAKTYTADVGDLDDWTMLGGAVYTPTEALSSVVFAGKIHVGVVNATSRQATVLSHAFIGDAPVVPVVHKAVFRVDGSVYKEVEFEEGATNLIEPAVPAKVGYTGSWSAYKLGTSDLIIDAVYTPNTYKITFVNWDGSTLQAARSYAFGSRVGAPANPKRPDSGGYRYAFAGWSPSFSGTCDRAFDTVYRAQFTKKAIEHTVTFVADGTTVAKLRFNEVDRKLVGAVPAVPAKPGYTGAWESYQLGSEDVTVRARYALRPDAVSLSTDAHIQGKGWIGYKGNGSVVGTTGLSLRMESIKVRLTGPFADSNSIAVRAHVQGIGWMTDQGNDRIAGTTGRSLRIEAMKIKLGASLSSLGYHVYYRVHAQGLGWMGWAHDGSEAGTAGNALRLEAIQIVLIGPGQNPPTDSYGGLRSVESHPYIDSSNLGAASSSALVYDGMVHVQGLGDVYTATNGAQTLGTTGRSLRLEGLKLSSSAPRVHLAYRTHVQSIGWQSWVDEGSLSGTRGRSLRLEAIQVKLTGLDAGRFDVYYRTHVQGIGWTGWARNGQRSGSAGYAYRMEAIQLMIIPKDGAAPGLVGGAFYQR